MNPTTAQIQQMTGGGPVAIVAIHPPAPHDTEHVIVGQEMLQLPGNEWQPFPYNSKLGVEILYAAPTTGSLPFFTIVADRNATLETLTLDCDPSSPSFGHSERTSNRGAAFKFRDDSKTMQRAILEPLVMFINERFTANQTALAGPDGMDQATKEYEKLNSQAFRMLFKKYRADQARAYPDKHWKVIDCPAAPSMINCETCGKAEDVVAGGNAMQRCARCKKVRYCGKECQAKDWKAHKPFCRE